MERTSKSKLHCQNSRNEGLQQEEEQLERYRHIHDSTHVTLTAACASPWPADNPLPSTCIVHLAPQEVAFR